MSPGVPIVPLVVHPGVLRIERVEETAPLVSSHGVPVAADSPPSLSRPRFDEGADGGGALGVRALDGAQPHDLTFGWHRATSSPAPPGNGTGQRKRPFVGRAGGVVRVSVCDWSAPPARLRARRRRGHEIARVVLPAECQILHGLGSVRTDVIAVNRGARGDRRMANAGRVAGRRDIVAGVSAQRPGKPVRFRRCPATVSRAAPHRQ